MRFRAGVLLAVLFVPLGAQADVVYLKAGSTLEGVVTASHDEVTIRLESGGDVILPKSDVLRIERQQALTEFALKAKRVRAGDIEGLRALARWAKANGLESKTRTTYQRILAIDPKDREALDASTRPPAAAGISPQQRATKNDACTEICVRKTIGRRLVQSGTDSMGHPLYSERAVGGVGSPEYKACVDQCRQTR
jgi:hypothetical protein